MNYYEMNMDCIKKNKYNLYSKIKSIDFSSYRELDEIQSVDTKDGKKALKVKRNSVEYRLNSIYKPEEEARRWVSQYKFHNLNTVISMFGFGNGIFARVIIEKMRDNDLLIIYEPCVEIFYYVLNNYDITDIISSNQVAIFLKDINDFEFHTTLQATVNISNMKSQIHCIYPKYDKIFAESCSEFFKELRDNYSFVKGNINTKFYFAQKKIDNIFKNIKFLKDSISLLELKQNMPKNASAIIVAAGPSVENNLEELREAKGKAIIFAVDRILDYLLDAGIEPDFVVTIDGKKPIKYFSRREDIKVPLITYLNSNADILEWHKGRKIVCTQDTFADDIYKETKKTPPFLVSSGSVAIVAYSACVELGFKRIILVGQDLAFQGMQSHVGGVEETRGVKDSIYVEGIDGCQVKSRDDWKSFIRRYEDLIKVNSDVEVIDAKNTGAKIKGTVVMPLKTVIDKYCNTDFILEDILENIESTFDSEDLLTIKNYLDRSRRDLIKIKEKAEKAVNLCNKQIKLKIDTSYVFQENMKKLKKINNYIERQPIYSIMDSYIMGIASEELSEIYQLYDDEEKDNLNTFKKSKVIYKAVIKATDYTLPRIKEAIDSVI